MVRDGLERDVERRPRSFRSHMMPFASSPLSPLVPGLAQSFQYTSSLFSVW